MNFSILQTAGVFVLVFAILVFFHELGHFLLAKLFRMRVEEFALGMGPRVVRLFSDGETDYTIRAIPLGGFVRIAGMEVEDAVESRLTGVRHHDLETTNIATIEQEADAVAGKVPDGFNSRPIYQRFLVILAGPVFSFLLGWLTLCLIGATAGVPGKSTIVVDKVTAGSVAQAAGFHDGDVIRSIDGAPVENQYDGLRLIRASAGKPLTFVVTGKEGQERTVRATPRAEKDPATGEKVGLLGFRPDVELLSVRRTSLAESFATGNEVTVKWFRLMGQLVASGAIAKNVGGPVAILKETADASKRGGPEPMSLLGQLSLSLGLFNLLPIPVLDGGHLLLLSIEGVRGRKLTAEQTSRVLTAGLAILACLFVLVMFKDIRAQFFGG
jgi:regulator of sigma E protease